MVSVIIPTYNRENTIKRSLISVLKQTYDDIEVIVVDDCSLDNTEQVIKEINSDKIKYFRLEKNSGGNYARNFGIEHSSGEFIAFQDSDDEWFDNKLEKQMNILLEKDMDIVASSFFLIDGENKQRVPKGNISVNAIKRKIIRGNFISTQTILGKRKCFVEEKFDPSIPRFQDWELSIRLCNKYKVFFINDPLVNVYLQSDSITQNTNKAVSALKLILDKHKKLIESDKKALSRIFSMIAVYSLQSGKFERQYFIDAYKYSNKIELKKIIDFVLAKSNNISLLKKLHHVI